MRCNRVVEGAFPVVPEGEYKGVPVSIRDIDCCYGARIHIEFLLSGYSGFGGCFVFGIIDNELNEDTELGRWVAAILGRMPEVGEEVSADDLLHKECCLVIRHKANTKGQVFAAVVLVLPPAASP